MKKHKLSPIVFILFLGVLHLLCASLSWAAPVESNWKLGLSGANAQDAQSSSQYVSFGLDTKTKYWSSSQMFINFDALLKFENGSFQTLDGDRKNESGIRLREAGVHWMVFKNSVLSAGALNQATQHSDLLIGDQAFPTVRVTSKLFDMGSVATSFDLEQAIPTSSSLSTNTTGVEGIPRFVGGGLNFNYEASRSYWRTRVGAFSFGNLPSSVAYESSLRGNTVLSLTETESLFVYKYEGIEAVSSLRLPMMRGWDFTSQASFLQNNKASNGYGRGYALSAGSEFFFVGQKSLEAKLTTFRLEPDAAVAFFSSSKYFHTNRVGYNIESFMNFRKHGFRVGLGYTEAEVIYLNPVQSREKSLMLMLETFYANI